MVTWRTLPQLCPRPFRVLPVNNLAPNGPLPSEKLEENVHTLPWYNFCSDWLNPGCVHSITLMLLPLLHPLVSIGIGLWFVEWSSLLRSAFCQNKYYPSKVLTCTWGRHFSHKNPHLIPISHFSGQNSIICIEMSCGKWEVRSEHYESSFLISHILFPASHNTQFFSIVI